MQIDVNGPRGKAWRTWNDQLWGSGGQSSRSHEAEDRFRGLTEVSFSVK